MSLLDSMKNLVMEQVDVPETVNPTPVTPTIQPRTGFITPPPGFGVSVPAFSAIGTPDANQIAEIDKQLQSKLDQALAINTPPLYTELNDMVATMAEDMPNIASRYKLAIKMLLKKGNNTPPLYTELNDMVATMAEDMPNISSRYKLAIKMLLKKGNTAINIVAAFDSVISVLQSKGKEFSDSISKKMDERVGSRKTAVENFDKSIADKTSQIQTLQTDIMNLNSQKATVSNEIITETQAITLKQSRFQVIYDQYLANLNSQKQTVVDSSK